jgi:protein gp37
LAAVKFLSIEPLLEDIGELDLSGIDWVIVGGESGPGARPMRPDWVISISEQCAKRNVLFFFKQWGGVRKKKASRELNGSLFDEFPQIRTHESPSKAERFRIVNAAKEAITEMLRCAG